MSLPNFSAGRPSASETAAISLTVRIEAPSSAWAMAETIWVTVSIAPSSPAAPATSLSTRSRLSWRRSRSLWAWSVKMSTVARGSSPRKASMAARALSRATRLASETSPSAVATRAAAASAASIAALFWARTARSWTTAVILSRKAIQAARRAERLASGATGLSATDRRHPAAMGLSNVLSQLSTARLHHRVESCPAPSRGRHGCFMEGRGWPRSSRGGWRSPCQPGRSARCA